MNRREIEKALSVATARMRYELERFLAQARFAEGLCELHPDKAARWKKLIARAGQIVDAVDMGGSIESVRAAVREAEAVMAPIGKAAKTYTVYCVGHAHIDMNWMWSWPETVATTNDTFSTVLRLMDEYPDFCFTQSQASVYAIVQKLNPGMLKRIRRRVKEGRWEVAASHWVEGDKNLVSGESLCRHLLYTRRYMKELFGLSPEDVTIDWSPDTFGHAVTIPSYLVRGGVRRYYCCRPGTYGPARPPVFWWQAPDGSRVLVNREIRWYNGEIEPGVGQSLLDFARQTSLHVWMRAYGVGDHGGGPTRRDILCAHDLDSWPVFPNVKLSTTEPFYRTLEEAGDRLPTLDCELNFEFEGCYTSQSLIKKSIRYAENQLCCAEGPAAIAWAAFGWDYPLDELREGWRNTLFGHFHDILPGSGVHDTRTYIHGKFQDTAAMTGMVETQALRFLASRVDTSPLSVQEPEVPALFVRSGLGAGAGMGSGTGSMSVAEQSGGQGARPFVVFNPSAWDRSEVVTATVWDNAPGGADELGKTTFSARAPSGKLLPTQVMEAGHFWGHRFVRLAFPAECVPGLGYSLYTMVEAEAGAAQPGVRTAEPFGMENDLIAVDIDPDSGGIRMLKDKASEVNLVDPSRPAAVLEFATEAHHGMTAWLLAPLGPISRLQVVSVKRDAKGPHAASVRVDMRLGESSFAVKYELRAGEPSLCIDIEATWLERGSPERGVPVLRMAFPLALAHASARYEIPFGSIERPLNAGEEVPAIRWAQVTGTSGRRKAGCLLLNDSKHGHSLDGSVLRLTLIRSSYDPDPLPEINQHSIRLALSPFAGERTVAEAMRLGESHNRPLRVVGTDVHNGPLPPTGRFASIAPESIILSCLKKAEKGDALVLRLLETAGRRTTARIRLDRKLLGEVRSAQEGDIMERPAPKSTAKSAGDTVSVAIPAYGIATVLVKTRRK